VLIEKPYELAQAAINAEEKRQRQLENDRRRLAAVEAKQAADAAKARERQQRLEEIEAAKEKEMTRVRKYCLLQMNVSLRLLDAAAADVLCVA
jgi:hypothetical protein